MKHEAIEERFGERRREQGLVYSRHEVPQLGLERAKLLQVHGWV
jgi:predicted transcriptional regulator